MNIAIFASGAGSNAEVIIKTLSNYLNDENAIISVIVTNNTNAGILNIAKQYYIPSALVNFETAADYLSILNKYKIDFIVLAGYLKKIPLEVIKAYPQKIINIHPALLPNYGGAGMYGKRVHEAVVAAGEKQSGITIHYVDEVYDNGKIIFQDKCDLVDGETGESLAKKVLALEHKHYTNELSKLLLSQIPVK